MTPSFNLCVCLYVIHADAEAHDAPAGSRAWLNRVPRQPVVDSFEEGLPFDLEKLTERRRRRGKATGDTHARGRELRDHFTERGVLAADGGDGVASEPREGNRVRLQAMASC